MRIDITKDRKLAEGLTTAEIRNASFQGAKDIDSKLVSIFALLRKWAGNKPIKINSAYRNYVPKGGVKDSAHMRGNAFDLGMSADQIEKLRVTLPYWFPECWSLGLRGLGIYNTFIHIDTEADKITNDWILQDGKSYPLRHWGKTWLTRGGETKLKVSFVDAVLPVQETTAEKQIINAEIETDQEHATSWRKYVPYLLGLGIVLMIVK